MVHVREKVHIITFVHLATDHSYTSHLHSHIHAATALLAGRRIHLAKEQGNLSFPSATQLNAKYSSRVTRCLPIAALHGIALN